MPGAFVHHLVRVQASKEVLWAKLLDKIRNPEKYVPGVVNVEILKEFSALSVERKMQLGEGGRVVHELITADPLTLTVIFKTHASDPHFRGFVTNTVFLEGEDVYLDYTLNWIGKHADAPDLQSDMEQAIVGAVEHTKQVAEGAEGSTPG